MSVTTILSVGYHQQDTGYYCGAACSQMVLSAIGAGILDQDDLYADCHGQSTLDPTSNWYTGPDGLTWTLNDRRPPGSTDSFELAALDSEDAISRQICWAIRQHGVAPVALVNGWQHWIVVLGYAASQHPTSASDPSYTIDGLDMNDPWPPTPSTLAAPPPHAAGDGCGTGGGRGTANLHVSYTFWKSMMTGVPGGYWQGKFVAVGVGDKPAAAPDASECAPEPKGRAKKRKRDDKSPRNAPTRAGRGSGFVSQRKAATLAIRGLKAHGLHEREGWSRALDKAAPGPGQLVQRLDRDDTFYSVVQFTSSRGTEAIVSVDARSGEYLLAGLLPKASKDFFPLSREAAADVIVGRRIELGGNRGRLLVRKEAMSQYPLLVWRPCRESFSPFYPFYMFIVGRHRLYVRADGAIFPSLTTDAAGI